MSASYPWACALFENALEPSDHFSLVRLESGHQLCGLIPLVTRKRRLSRINKDVFDIASLYGTHGDLLLANTSDTTINVFFNALKALESGWDRFVATRFVETNPRLKALRKRLSTTSFRVHERLQPPTFYIRLHAPADDFMRSRSKNLRRNITKARNRLDKAGKGEVISYRDFPSVDEAFEALLAIERETWKHESGTAISSSDGQAGFFRKLCVDAAKTGWLHLVFLSFNGEPVAFDLGLLYRGRYSYLKTSYKKSFHQLGPAGALRASMVEDIIARGAKELDFTAEPYEWQTRWTDEKREHRTLIIYNDTLRARALERISALRDRIQQRVPYDARQI